MLHKAFDILQAGMRRITKPLRDLALHLERQPLLGAPRMEMHVAANRPEEVLAAAEGAIFLGVEHAMRHQLVGCVHAINILRNPEQSVQVAKATLAFLYVRLDKVSRLSGAAMPLLALRKLCRYEFGRGTLNHLPVEACDEVVIQTLSPVRNLVSSTEVRIVMSPRACRIDSSIERVA